MMTAEALLMLGDANIPAKKRQTFRLAKPVEKLAPIRKTMNTGVVTTNTTFRPYRSDKGAPTIGPNANPRLYNDRGKTAAIELQWNEVTTASWAGA